ncbi:metallophosphoesterase [Paenibacillus sp. HWE-109]|uniref:metallophosphoesterase family protein n=1 Tax=Paenibacillus sp. HWE-109 TaxID=1306526 RepID=UPI001EE11A3D|nr:metallophosphoesterase [Paenibacillus sp. HWE-109]UKS26457.1 metallophosphoesterase [Paenibacillus sp. HWE-109]
MKSMKLSNGRIHTKSNLRSVVIRILLFSLLVLLLPTYAWEATATAPATPAATQLQSLAPLTIKKLQMPISTEPLFSFSVLSDVHVGAKDKDSQERFRAALADQLAIRPDSKLMVLNGDLTNGINNDYKSLFKIMYEFTLPPVHATMGNHEYYGLWETKQEYLDTSKLRTDWSSRQAINSFQQMFNYDKPYHELVMEDYHFLFLSGEAYQDLDASVKEDAYLSPDQLAWFQAKLKLAAEAGPDKPIFVFLHQPLVHTLGGSDQDLGVVQHEELRAILNQYPNIVFFTGHTHWNLETTEQIKQLQFLAVGSSSVREVWNDHNEPEGSKASQSLVVDVFADQIAIQGREHSEKRWIEPAFVKRYSEKSRS